MIRTTCKIDGMMCGMCEAHMNDTIRKSFDVKKVSSSHSKGETVILSEKPLDRDALERAVADTGYDLLSLETEEVKKSGIFGFLHR